MKTFARMQDGRVAELLTTDMDIRTMFHPSLVWQDVTAVAGITVGWRYDAGQWFAPEPASAPTAAPSLTDLQSRLAALSAQIAAMAKAG